MLSQLEQLVRQPSAPNDRHAHAARLRVAIVLNGNARAVSDGVVDRLRRLVDEERIFVSTSLEHARFIARQILAERYDVVLCGGGDGTFTRCVSDVMALRPSRPPAFGVLRLGTGNALAEVLGASAGVDRIADDLRSAHDPDARIELPLLRVEGQLTPFAGVGLDSMILEDYHAVRERLGSTPLSFLGESQAGYGLAIGTRTIWRYLRERRPQLVIRNEGLPATPVDLRGAPVGPAVGRGEILYRGPVTIAAASTVPFFGFGARIFPQACLRTGRFQLRVGNVPLKTMLRRLPQILSGEFDHERMWDYVCSAVSIELARPTPLQIGGDLIGTRRRVRIDSASVAGVYGPRGLAVAPAPEVEEQDQPLRLAI